jgi:serine protease Do
MENRSDKAFLLILLFLLVLVIAACGGGEAPIVEEAIPTEMPTEQVEEAQVVPTQEPPTEEPPTEEPPATEAPPAETPTAAPAKSFQDIQEAIIQIEAQGSFVDPAEGMQLNTAGRGSGFIIDESGLAVTNNHVVTGAAILQVWVGGEEEPRNAKILGVSECSDLAVIDIDGDNYAFLDWFEGEANVGLEIYVAGFPLGDPEYTLTRGIVSKQEADGDTAWSSVDHVIEYDANTNPGNSGGAVVDENGRVIAVHYAGRSDTRQAFGISHDVAEAIVEQLRQGQDIHTIGVNGSAINDGEGLSGIWVSSVESGSPADTAGLKGGDIITKMEGLVLATDGTMADYCDILRSHNQDDILSIEVLRFDTQEVLEGQLNGRPLEQSFSFAQEIAEPEAGEVEGTAVTYENYVGIYDDAESVYMEVPEEWSAIDGAPWEDEGDILGASLIAASDLQGFNDSYETPGVQLLASNILAGSDMNELADFFDFSEDCAYDGRFDYDDSVFQGVYDQYADCLDSGNVLIILAAEPEDTSYAVILVVQAVTSADLDALDQILNTFNVVGTLPGS